MFISSINVDVPVLQLPGTRQAIQTNLGITEPAPMNPHPVSTPVTPTLRSEAASDASTRLHGRWLLLARLGWAILVLLTLSVFAASIPARYAELGTVVKIAEPATRFD